ncbi:glycosyltransferase [Methylogaea oryzae]|uniref:glycosyltransferase family protein n=1 Tax=Methylogaea oryzae TaxID=1295382 RepID=UPI0006D23784|nr:glycosyltransferase [Methylogaea oryzae]
MVASVAGGCTAEFSDAYFLDYGDAYGVAMEGGEIVDEAGIRRPRYCYYDGALGDAASPYLIGVPSDDIVTTFCSNRLPVPGVIAFRRDGVLQFENMPQDVLDEIVEHRQQYFSRPSNAIHLDTYFLDPLEALNTAKQHNRIYNGHPTIDSPQLCFYGGDAIAAELSNLIWVPYDRFVDFFTMSPLKMPAVVKCREGAGEAEQAAANEEFQQLLRAVEANSTNVCTYLGGLARAQRPDFSEPVLRVFVVTSRYTTVMQYCARGVAKAFERRGCRVMFVMEQDERERLCFADLLSKYVEFNPHVFFEINRYEPRFLNDHVAHIVWWQDLLVRKNMKTDSLSVREREFHYSISTHLDEELHSCGASAVRRLNFCIDEEVFNPGHNPARSRKVVFVGANYPSFVDFSSAAQCTAVALLTDLLVAGKAFGPEVLRAVAEQSGVDPQHLAWRLLPYAIRSLTVRWLCECATIPVEIYGRHWESDPVVARFFKGEAPHGVAVADIYRSAQYAFACHAFDINSQRLAEAAACGCTPIVFDCRELAEPPYWEEACLYFKTQAELQDIIDNDRRAPHSPHAIAAGFTYDRAVERFLADMGPVVGL